MHGRCPYFEGNHLPLHPNLENISNCNAKALGFEHPTTGEWMQFDSVLPEDIQALLEKWRRYAVNTNE